LESSRFAFAIESCSWSEEICALEDERLEERVEYWDWSEESFDESSEFWDSREESFELNGAIWSRRIALRQTLRSRMHASIMKRILRSME